MITTLVVNTFGALGAWFDNLTMLGLFIAERSTYAVANLITGSIISGVVVAILVAIAVALVHDLRYRAEEVAAQSSFAFPPTATATRTIVVSQPPTTEPTPVRVVHVERQFVIVE